MSALPLLATAEIRTLEERAAAGLPGPTLMQRAGRATAEAARAKAAGTGAPVLVVAGPGNNGGDAWVAAERLREGFHRVTVLDVSGATPKAPEARQARERFVAAGGATVREWPAAQRPALVVDGLLGIGLVLRSAVRTAAAGAHRRCDASGQTFRRPDGARAGARGNPRSQRRGMRGPGELPLAGQWSAN